MNERDQIVNAYAIRTLIVTCQSLVEILIEKGVFTKEELDLRYSENHKKNDEKAAELNKHAKEMMRILLEKN